MIPELTYKKNWLPVIHRVAAIDLGSNAVRLFVAEVYGKDFYMPLKTSRKPLRLGKEVFDKGVISEKSMVEALSYFEEFKKILNKYNVTKVHAVATSALRESSNSKKFIKLIRSQTGIDIKLISGEEEAMIIYAGISKGVDLSNKNVLLIDIGGGSLELTSILNGKRTLSKSFQIGTVRSLLKMKKNKIQDKNVDDFMDQYRHEIENFISSFPKSSTIDLAIGTGGNFERFAKIQSYFDGVKDRGEVSYYKFSHIKSILENMKLDERIQSFLLKRDRADVIIPAGAIIKMVMEVSQIETIKVPGVGLKDGIVYQIADEIFP